MAFISRPPQKKPFLFRLYNTRFTTSSLIFAVQTLSLSLATFETFGVAISLLCNSPLHSVLAAPTFQREQLLSCSQVVTHTVSCCVYTGIIHSLPPPSGETETLSTCHEKKGRKEKGHTDLVSGVLYTRGPLSKKKPISANCSFLSTSRVSFAGFF